MEYRYRLTRWECFLFAFRVWREKYVRPKRVIGGIIYWLFMLTCGIRYDMAELGLEPLWYVLCVVGFIIYAGGTFLGKAYKVYRKIPGRQEQVIQVKDGKLVLGQDGRLMFLLSDLSIEKEGRWLLILKFHLPGKVIRYIFIPKRVFGSEEECHKFKRTLQDGWKWNELYAGEAELEKEFYMNKIAVAHLFQVVGVQEDKLDKYYNGLIQVGYYHFLVGKRTVRMYRDCIEVQIGDKRIFHSWQTLPRLKKTAGLYLFCDEKGKFVANIPCCLFTSEEEEQSFLVYCRKQGMSLELEDRDLCDLDASEYLTEVETYRLAADDGNSGFRKYILPWLIGWFVLAIVAMKWMDHVVLEESKDYVSLNEQVKILESLDISVSEECIRELEEWVAEDVQGREYVERNPFYRVLCYMGSPQYDWETWEIVAYPDGLYWFDRESYDLVTDYVNILNAVEHLSQGELDIEEITIHDEDVNWEKVDGTLCISYTCNRNPYECVMFVNGEWLSEYVIRDLNDMLKQEMPEKRIYYCYDDGQGVMVFYKDADWEKEFEEKTNIDLYQR